MEFLSSQKIDLRQASLICRQSRFVIAIFCLLMFGAAGAFIAWHVLADGPAVFVWFSTPMLVFAGLIGLVWLKRSLRPANWIMAILPQGIAVKLMSFLHVDEPEGADTVLLRFDEIRQVRAISEKCKLQDGGRTTYLYWRYLGIECSIDLRPLGTLLQELRKQTRNAGIKHYPVRLDNHGVLRLCWTSKSDRIRPSLSRTLHRLSSYCHVAEPSDQKMHGPAAELDRQTEEKLLSLAESGEIVQAVRLCRTAYGMSTTEARQFVDELIR